MTSGSGSLADSIVDQLLSVKYAEISIGGRKIEISVPLLNSIFDPEEAAKNAVNIAIVANMATSSQTLRRIASESPSNTKVNVVIEFGDYGQLAGELRSHSKPGFEENVWTVKIHVNDTNYGYTTRNAGSARFTLQHLLNHELLHAFTNNHPDTPWFLNLVNEINDETRGGLPRDLNYKLEPTRWKGCFLAGTIIDMWDGSKKPIEMITPDDWVVSYNENGTLVPGRVSKTFRHQARHILDVFGLMVTPGHITLCGDGPLMDKHVPIIDILRTDGALVLRDGTKIRACTGIALGAFEDKLIWAITGNRIGRVGTRVRDKGQIRLGTRFINKEGVEICVADLISESGGTITEDGLVQVNNCDQKMPFLWSFSNMLPKPEDYILQRSSIKLFEIYEKNEQKQAHTYIQ
ncbi:MAG: hypothetical protein COB90_10290 [Hyphomicrobiales bacterium]|nr:MAG: hypothetical protein COB90_10290 [Hyphomicrobiales bacterium]